MGVGLSVHVQICSNIQVALVWYFVLQCLFIRCSLAAVRFILVPFKRSIPGLEGERESRKRNE